MLPMCRPSSTPRLKTRPDCRVEGRRARANRGREPRGVPIMDEQHIHAVTHTLRRLPSRRDVLRGFAGAGLGLNGLWLAGGVAAKKKKRRKKRRAGTVPADTGTVPAAQCLRTCDQRICGSDGCGGSCGSCATDQVCVSGGCVDEQTDVRNCGFCGRHCTVNEQCVGGECLCGVSSCSALPGFSCCTN